LKARIITISFHAAGNVCVDKLRLKISFNLGKKFSEQSFTTKLGMTSSPTGFVDGNRLIALLTSSSLAEATADVSLHYENRLKVFRKALAISSGLVK
jgi:hypothetical protein